jgi:pyruvate-formate lyase-activating enzyme
MENPNLLIQEKYASQLIKKSIEQNVNFCELFSLYIGRNNDVFLCSKSVSFGNLSSEPIDVIFQNIIRYKKDPFKKSCSCNNNEINFSLLSSGYLENSHPIKELSVYSNIDKNVFANLLVKIKPDLKIIKIVAENELSLLAVLNTIPSDVSVRIDIDTNILNPSLINLLGDGKYFVNINCNSDFKHEIQKKNFFSIKFYVSEKNYQQAYNDYLLFSQKNLSMSLDLKIEKSEDMLMFAQHLLKLENRYDAFFLDSYEALERSPSASVTPKLKQMLKIKWLNISYKAKKLCSIPFSEMSVSADGSFQPCCWISDSDLRDNQTGNDVGKIWNGQKIKSLRNEFISGDLKTCGKKIKEYACNPSTGIGKHFATYTTDIDRPMLKFHWFFNGACNLECQMCSAWLQDKEFSEIETYFEDLKKNVLPFLGEIEVVGGEPFYQKRTYALIEFMKEANPLCVWNITSNGQFNFEGKIKQAITGLRLGIFSISIDSLIADIFSKIRIKGELQQTLNFLDDLLAFRKAQLPGFKFQININFVVQKDNWSEVENIILFAKEKGVELYISPLAHFPQFSIYTLDTEEKRNCLKYMEMIYHKYRHPNLLTLINNLACD